MPTVPGEMFLGPGGYYNGQDNSGPFAVSNDGDVSALAGGSPGNPADNYSFGPGGYYSDRDASGPYGKALDGTYSLIGGSGSAPGPEANSIGPTPNEVGDVSTYTLSDSDEGSFLIFSAPAGVTIVFPDSMLPEAGKSLAMMAVNTLGTITIPDTGIVAYAAHADKNVTLGIIRTETRWIVTGTNIPEELA